MPLIHSQNIQNEHTRYINSLEKIISKKLKNVRGGKKTFSFDIYKISYSAFVLTTELAKKSRQNRTSSYLQELRSEIVSTVALTTIGFDSSLHLRRCIELALKHIFYADHPIEYTISMESRKSKEDLTVKELFDYAKKNPLLRVGHKLRYPISNLENSYNKLCEVVHARRIIAPSKLEHCTIPKRAKEQLEKEKESCRTVMRNIALLLMIYHKKKISQLGALQKEAVLFSMPPSFVKEVRTELDI